MNPGKSYTRWNYRNCGCHLGVITSESIHAETKELSMKGTASQLAEKVGRTMKGAPSAAKSELVYSHLRTD
jgi:hypothetical protein